MSIEQYYTNQDKLNAPDGLDAFDRAQWYKAESEKLKKELSEEDLKTVTDAEKQFNYKMQSAHGTQK